MANITIGATHISNQLFSILSKTELAEDNSLYHLNYLGKNIFIIYNISGYFEVGKSYIDKNQIKNPKDFKNLSEKNSQFFDEIIAHNETKFICSSITLDEKVYQNEKVKENFKRYNQILEDIESSLKRGAKMWYYSLYQKCFFNYSYPEVYLTKDGFTFENGIVVFSPITKRTIKTNLDKLKSLNLLDYEYKKNKVSHLKFNLNKFPLLPELIPLTFSTAFYEQMNDEQFAPINNQLKKIGVIEKFESKNFKKTDYVLKQIENELIGTNSEKLALEFEIDRLKKTGLKDCSQKVKLVSDNSSFGYDILSFENERENRYIEVKTIKRFNDLYSFYITENEIEKIKKLSNYYIYLVAFTKKGHNIKIIETTDLLNSEYFKIVPTDYKVYLKF